MTTSLQAPEPLATRHETARFTWRELLGPYGSEPGWSGGVREAIDADRDDLPCGSKVLRERAAIDPSIGGLLLWNRTQDPEGGTLVMLTGQDCTSERQVVDNGTWLVTRGAVYAESRVGSRAKADADHAFNHETGDRWLCWLLWNDRDVFSLAGHKEYLKAVRG